MLQPEQTDIVQVVRSRIELTPHGSEYRAICPFHEDTKPSLTIVPDKNFYYCFACQQGGNPINFIAEYDNISYRDAANELAEELGIEVVESKSNHQVPRKEVLDYLTLIYDRITFNNGLFHSGMLGNDYELNKACGLIDDSGLKIFGKTLAIYNMRQKVIGLKSEYGIARSSAYTYDAYMGEFSPYVSLHRRDIGKKNVCFLLSVNKNTLHPLARNFGHIRFKSDCNIESLISLWPLSDENEIIEATYIDDAHTERCEEILARMNEDQLNVLLSRLDDRHFVFSYYIKELLGMENPPFIDKVTDYLNRVAE